MSHLSCPTHLETAIVLRERILDAAKAVFDARGYAVVTIEEISSQSGVGTSTITDLFPTTYELFRECAFSEAHRLLSATDCAATPPADARHARATLVGTLESLAKAAIAGRTGGNSSRGQTRYLSSDDQRELQAIDDQLHDRVQGLLRRVRPALDDLEARILAVAAVSTITSVTTHFTTLPAPKIQTLLSVSAMRLIDNEPALTAPTTAFRAPGAHAWLNEDQVLSDIMSAGIELIHARGFSSVSFDDIAAASGADVPTIASYFTTTADLLHAAFGAGGDALRTSLVTAATDAGTRPRDILHALSHAYVEHFFGDAELMTLFILDAHHLPPQHLAGSLQLHHEFMAGWLGCLAAIRPELTESEAKFLVYAALSIVFDVGGSTRWRHDPRVMVAIERLLVTTLIGGR